MLDIEHQIKEEGRTVLLEFSLVNDLLNFHSIKVFGGNQIYCQNGIFSL